MYPLLMIPRAYRTTEFKNCGSGNLTSHSSVQQIQVWNTRLSLNSLMLQNLQLQLDMLLDVDTCWSLNTFYDGLIFKMTV
jgi:hypothetical protein